MIVLGDFNANSAADKVSLTAQKDLINKKQASDKKHGHVQNLNNGNIDFSVMQLFFEAGLTDSTEQVLADQDGSRLTCPTGIFTDKKTPPGEGERIDFILVSHRLAARLKKSWIPTQGATNQISDHYPVISEFK